MNADDADQTVLLMREHFLNPANRSWGIVHILPTEHSEKYLCALAANINARLDYALRANLR